MGPQPIMDMLISQGPFAAVCAVLLIRDWLRDKRDSEREKRRDQIEKDRIEADKALAVSMTILSERIR